MKEKTNVLTVDDTPENIIFYSTTNRFKIRVVPSYLAGVSYER